MMLQRVEVYFHAVLFALAVAMVLYTLVDKLL